LGVSSVELLTQIREGQFEADELCCVVKVCCN